MKLLLCINRGTTITIPAGSGTFWHGNFVTHREMDKCRSGSFTPQDVIAQRIQQAKGCEREIGVGKDKCMTRRMGSRAGCTILIIFVNCVLFCTPYTLQLESMPISQKKMELVYQNNNCNFPPYFKRSTKVGRLHP